MTFHVRRTHAAGKLARSKTNDLGHKLSPRVAVSLSEADYLALVKAAADAGIPIGAVVRNAVDQYLKAQAA